MINGVDGLHESQPKAVGTSLGQLGRSFGVWSGQVRSSLEMRPQLVETLQAEGPAILEVDMTAIGPQAVQLTGAARQAPRG